MIELENKNLQTFEYETTAISDGKIIGTCELGRATIQMLNDNNEYSSLKNKWIKTIHGSMYIHNVEPVQEKVNIKLHCYDIKYKLDTPYNSSLYTWPVTMKEWRNAIFTNCGLTYDDSDFPNSDLVLDKEPYIGDNPSNRSVISLIAQAGCSWVDTDANDIFYFKWFEDIVYEAKDWTELTTEKDYSNPINVVVLGRGDVEDNVKWPETLPANPTEFRIDNNYVLDPQEDNDQRYDVIQPIYNRVNGFSYLIFTMRTQEIDNKLNVKLGQKTSYIDIWGNKLNAYIMSKKIIWLGGDPNNSDNYEIILSAEKLKETATEFSYASSIKNKLLKVERTADKNTGKINDLIAEVDENIEKINTLEMTSSSTTSKISNIEKELQTTNQNINDLDSDIQGVNANFNDFKDNEYVQSINNLQSQIDGAIQFWNGSEIPTLENFPTNEWTTENEKINHQADIYTVIEDIEGELKQGKAYRFDKVNGVWQWIELTDNELSAVQALAQEALKKANSNANEIEKINSNVSELKQTDEEIKASVSEIKTEVVPTGQASGSNIHISDSADAELLDFKLYGKSTQETRSGKNIITGLRSSSNTYINYSIDTSKLTNQMTYSFIAPFDATNVVVYIRTASTTGIYSKGKINIVSNQKTSFTFELTDDEIQVLQNENSFIQLYKDGAQWGTPTLEEPQLENGATTTEYEIYSAMPSPDYPSEIKSVGYKNLYNYEDTIRTSNGAVADDDGWITITYDNTSGTTTVWSNYFTNNLDLKPNTQYAIFTEIKSVSGTGRLIPFGHNNPQTQGQFTTEKTIEFSSTSAGTIYKHIVTTVEDFTNIIYGLRTLGSFRAGESGSITFRISVLEDISVNDYLFEYVPYNKYGVFVKRTGANKFNLSDVVNPAKYTVTETGINMNSAWVTEIYYTKNVLKTFKPNTTYTMQVKAKVISRPSTTTSTNDTLFMLYRPATDELPRVWTACINMLDKKTIPLKTEKTYTTVFTTPKDMTNVKFIGYTFHGNDDGSTTGSATGEIDVSEIMLVEGEYTEETFPLYEKYKIITTLIQSDYPLMSNKDETIRDYIYLQNGNLYLRKNLKKAIYDGSEAKWYLSRSDATNNKYVFRLAEVNERAVIADTDTNYAISNYFATQPTVGAADAALERNYGVTFYYKADSPTAKSIYFIVKDITTLNDWKTWLSTHNVELIYSLAEPQDILIAENVDNLITYKNITNISTTDNLQPNMEVTYIRDNTLNGVYQTQNDMNKYYTKVENDAQLEILSDQISSSVTEINSVMDTIRGAIETINRTMLTQTADQFEMLFKQTGIKELVDNIDALTKSNNASLVEREQWIRFKGALIELGKSDSQAKLLLSNDRISFMVGGKECAYIKGDQLYCDNIVTKKITYEGYWETRIENGNKNTYWIGGVV